MPFDFAPMRSMPVDAEVLAGVPRYMLVQHALAQLPETLRSAVAEIEVAEAGQFVHMGMNFDRVAWRAVWRRPGLPAAGGDIPVWNGEIV